MIFGHQFVQVAGFVAVILVFAVFKGLFGLPYLRLPIVVVSIVYFLGFYLRTSDFYSASTAKQLDKRCPGTIRRYKSNVVYFIESLLAIVVLLIPITVLLFTMLFNQREVLHISFLTQCIIAGVGYLFLHLISVIYEIGPTHTIGYSAAAQAAARTAAARKQERENFQQQVRQEAEFVVKQAIMEYLNVPEEQITPTSKLRDWGAEAITMIELTDFYDNYLHKVHHAPENASFFSPYGLIGGTRMRQYEALRMRITSNVSKSNGEDAAYQEILKERLYTFREQQLNLYPLVKDQYEFVGELIAYYYRGKQAN